MGVTVKEKVKGSGEWWIFINHNGKRKAKKIGRDKRTATEAAKKIEAKLSLGDLGLIDKKSPTLSEYILGYREDGQQRIGWFDKFASLSLKASTQYEYRTIIDAHLIPAFGTTPLNAITPRMISDFLSKKMTAGIKSGRIRNIKNCLASIFRHAVTPDALLQSNPATGLKIAKPENERPPSEADPCTLKEVAIIEDVFFNSYPRYYPIIVAGFRTGLRLGELLALKWQYMDTKNRKVLVCRNLSRKKITTPKTRSSTRLVRMTTGLIEVLAMHKRQMQVEKLKKGWAELPEWIFPSAEGTPLNYSDFVRQVWNPAMAKTGLRRQIGRAHV